MADLLAQADAIPSLNQIGGWLGTVTTSGILGWFLWYTVTKVTPAREERHEATVHRLVQDFRAERLASQADFKASLLEVVAHCEKENNKLIAALERSYPKPLHGGGS